MENIRTVLATADANYDILERKTFLCDTPLSDFGKTFLYHTSEITDNYATIKIKTEGFLSEYQTHVNLGTPIDLFTTVRRREVDVDDIYEFVTSKHLKIGDIIITDGIEELIIDRVETTINEPMFVLQLNRVDGFLKKFERITSFNNALLIRYTPTNKDYE